MPGADLDRSGLYTKLAQWRVWRNLTQRELAERSGVPLSTLKRYEQGDYGSRPDLRYLSNLAMALGCESLLDVIEDDFLRWHPLGGRNEPPESEPYWEQGRPPEYVERALKRNRPLGKRKRQRPGDEEAERAFRRDFLGEELP